MSTLDGPMKDAPAAEAAADVPPSDELVLLEPATLHFRREGFRLQMRREGEETWQEVGLARLFPLTDTEGWIAVLNKDGKELGVLREVRALPREYRQAVLAELDRRYLVPQITRILACRDKFDLIEWEVQTDRGALQFLMRHPHENIQLPLPGRITLIDVEGNRYDVPDLGALDAESRRLLEARL